MHKDVICMSRAQREGRREQCYTIAKNVYTIEINLILTQSRLY